MAIALDASTPASVSSSGATTTTAAFTPPNASVLVACVSADANNGSNDETVSVSDSSSGTWNQAVLHNGNGGAVSAIFWRLVPTSISNMTVSCTDNKGSVAKRLRVQVWTGTDQTNPIGATNTSTTAGVSYTSTVDQSQGVSCGLTANATLTAGGTGNTLDDTTGGFDSGDATFVLIRTALTTPAGSTVTLTIAGTSTIAHHVAVELVPPAAASIPYNPQRTTPTRDYGETWWIQRDRRDANTVAAAANPLPSPLDVAWQVGGGYWHLYTDTAVRDRRLYVQQRAVFDPSLLDVVAAVPYCPQRLPQPRDSGEVQWEQRRPGDPTLLSTALLEGVLLGGSTTAQRANVPATHDDRREAPTQRLYISDPSFYPVAGVTDPITLAWGAGGTYWLIYNTAALDVDRREVPQQRRYVSDPGLLATALLENELLRGDGRHAAWFARPAFPLPTRPVGVLDVPAEPLQLTAELLRRLLTPATHADRRQAGQQPRRLVDQSTPRPPVVRATSTPAVTARRTSTTTVTARRTSTPEVEG